MDENFAQVGFLLTVITIVVLLLVLLLINLLLTSRNRRLRHQSEILQMQSHLREEISAIKMEVAEATLTDVSRDLHDEVGQLLTFSILQLENLADQPEMEKTQMIKEVKQSVRDALDSIRSISRGLSPDFVNQQGLVVSLEQLLDRASVRTGIRTKLDIQPGFAIQNTSNSVIVFRIVRECLTNAIRHGQANEITIHLSDQNGRAEVKILDNGVGMRKENNQMPGLGFKTMQKYAGLIQGTLTFESKNGDGTKILLNFPNTIL